MLCTILEMLTSTIPTSTIWQSHATSICMMEMQFVSYLHDLEERVKVSQGQ